MNQFLDKAIIDISAIAEDISAESSMGKNIREDAACVNKYYDLYDYRQNIRRMERLDEKIDQQVNLGIINKSLDVLLNHSKDIEICCWLIEAMVQQYGFAGLHDSVKALNGLIEKYNDTLYPENDEEFPEQKVVAITALDGGERAGTLEKPLNLSPLFTSNNIDITLWECKKNNEIDNDEISLLFNSLGSDQKGLQQEILEQSLIEIKILEDNLNILYSENALGLSAIKSILNLAISTLKKLDITSVDEEVIATSTDEETPYSDNKEVTAIESDYEKILFYLSEVTNYFNEHQPHSLVTHNLVRTQRWLTMSLADVLNEVISDNTAKIDIQRCFGVPIFDDSHYSESYD